MQFVLDADDADGERLHVTYGGPLDRSEQPLAGKDAVLVLHPQVRRCLERNDRQSPRVTTIKNSFLGSSSLHYVVASILRRRAAQLHS
jgi:hypothetical protein